MKRIRLIFLFVLYAGLLCAQPRFVVDTEIVMLGEVAFRQPKKIEVGFTNKGNRPLLLKAVNTFCGCMDVEFPREEIKPGDHGKITLTYDAKILGSFNREVEVITNASEEPVYIAINGVVVPEVKDYSKDFPINLGNVYLQSNSVEFDAVNMGDHPVAQLKLVNAGRIAYRPELMHLPPYLTAKCVPENVPPGQTGVIEVQLNSEKLSQMGLHQTSIYLARYMGDKISETNEIVVSAVLLPDFSTLSASDLQNAPELTVAEEVAKIQPFGEKEERSTKIVLTNTGKSNLVFNHVQVFSKGISVSLNHKVLKPGKSTKLKITANREYLKKSKVSPRVLLITNDPKHAQKIIDVEVEL